MNRRWRFVINQRGALALFGRALPAEADKAEFEPEAEGCATLRRPNVRMGSYVYTTLNFATP
jgi:hypothetical protein